MSASQDELRDEGARPTGPVSDAGLSLAGESSASSPPAGEADESEAQAVEEDFEKLLADANQEKEEYLELARRTKADFENFRKRVAGDVQAAQARGKAQIAPGLLDAIDNLERAFEAVGIDPQTDPLDQAAEATPDEFQHGVLLVLNGMRETLRSSGIEAVDPKGEKFDPNQHEALSTMPVEGTESGTVVEVMQKGYRMGEQLVRPARVVVSA
jgi:molecular chaperone GrpE